MNLLINHTFREDTTDSFLFQEWVKMNPDWLVMARNNGDVVFKEGFIGIFHNIYVICKLNPEKIYVTTTPFYNMFLLILIKIFSRNISVTYHVHDLYPDFFRYIRGYKVFYHIFKYPFKWAIKRTNIVTISDKIKEYLIINYSCLEENIFVVENFANVDFRPLDSVSFKERLVYIGNIGFAHDTSYANQLNNLNYDIVFKLSGVKKYHKKQNRNVRRIIDGNFRVIEERLSVKDLENLVDESFASVVFLGEGFDNVLFPCKIYSSLARLVPIVFCGPKNSYVLEWLEKNLLGVHITDIEELQLNRDIYLESIEKFNNQKRFKAVKL